ncbi:hypothetical protein [Ralstonia pseudosolanacearum]|uniref:hypothetical protein n=1 Tax=Ralstonia pseudosolanacearum TaxID=1310165 RepID=UPI003CF941CE
MASNTPPVSRSPRGVLTHRPVSTRLMEEELAALEALALEQNRSLSSVARLMIVKGLEASGCAIPATPKR